MTDPDADAPIDLAALDDASRRLLGYDVHRWFHAYLQGIARDLDRLRHEGRLDASLRPTARGRAAPVDVPAPDDYHALRDLVGLSLYLIATHKEANWRLRERHDARQVLYLRGYDFEAAFAAGGGLAAGLSTVDTGAFTLALGERLPHRVFKVLSPREVHWDTVTAERHYEDYGALFDWVRARPAALYLNARHWQEGVRALIPRMDHFVVYLSSLTESALWELDQLRTEGRRGRVTVVFDEAAIARKAWQLEAQEALGGRVGQPLWTKAGGPPARTPEAVRAELAAEFRVMSPAEFAADVDAVVRRIEASEAELPPGRRETTLDFAFHPAVDDAALARLHATSRALARRVDAARHGPIACPSRYLLDVRLRLGTALLLGDHAGAGRALAAYAAVMRAAADHHPATEGAGASADDPPGPRDVLERHAWFGAYAGRTLLKVGRSDAFESRAAEADATWDAIFGATRRSADAACAACAAPGA